MKQTAVEWLFRWFNDNQEATIEEGLKAFQQAKKLEEQQMLDFGSKVTERWGLTKVEPHYIKDEFDKQYKSE